MAAGFADFTPFHSLAGGLMMAASLHTLLSKLGLVLGISGFFHLTVSSILNAAMGKKHNSSTVSLAPAPIFPIVAQYFTTGILLGGAVLGLARPQIETGLGVPIFDAVSATKQTSFLSVAVFGGLVGFGTKLGSGCTSGHFLCGLSRLSVRSIVATATFFGVAVLSHVSLLNEADIRVSAVKYSTASHFPVRLPQPGFGTLLALQAPALFYRIVPELLDVTDPLASSEKKKASQLFAAKIIAFAVGVHFSFALGVSGMMRPSKVLGFLKLTPRLVSAGAWDPSLAMVAIGGIIPASIAYFRHVKPKQDKLLNSANKRTDESNARFRPALSAVAPEWGTPANPFKIDAKLVIGSILFGLGWGATGLCPGPALASLASLGTEAIAKGSLSSVSELLVFVAAMAAGGQVASKL
ncbi:uncharacterized protein MEPE_03548 [Melanopsichium pennsylvanicum]|uniref:Sulphur transport domain-containing protein n=2 Tax=Melanopsichium pennsylvanicum TaxID=63383 RepID=A0AAJ5C5T1_9BASI|nr:conserved hypothetical protein [Melanopsichium pennsylvanicum 4]SNX84839.1 uncharacterized protein MEPE_03548 [Melanopsichium pennsylvanicum]